MNEFKEISVNQPKVYIILVNYNGYSDTVECVKSLLSVTYQNFRIILVDNASTVHATQEQLDFLHSHAHIINLSINTGFSGGNNVGIQYALNNHADYVLLLNNDTVVKPDFLDELVNEGEKQQNVGCIIGRILFYDEPDVVWYAGGEFFEKDASVEHTFWGEHIADIDDRDKSRQVSFATGCMMLIPKKAIEKTGMLSEEYFLYSEDADYCCRLMQNSFNLFYCKESVIYHKISRSTGAESENTQYYVLRNKLMMINKYGKNKSQAYFILLIQVTKDLLKSRRKWKPAMWAVLDFLGKKDGKNTHKF